MKTPTLNMICINKCSKLKPSTLQVQIFLTVVCNNKHRLFWTLYMSVGFSKHNISETYTVSNTKYEGSYSGWPLRQEFQSFNEPH